MFKNYEMLNVFIDRWGRKVDNIRGYMAEGRYFTIRVINDTTPVVMLWSDEGDRQLMADYMVHPIIDKHYLFDTEGHVYRIESAEVFSPIKKPGQKNIFISVNKMNLPDIVSEVLTSLKTNQANISLASKIVFMDEFGNAPYMKEIVTPQTSLILNRDYLNSDTEYPSNLVKEVVSIANCIHGDELPNNLSLKSVHNAEYLLTGRAWFLKTGVYLMEIKNAA